MKLFGKALIAMSILTLAGTLLSASAETPTYVLAKDEIVSYVAAAREAYPSDPDYKISVTDTYVLGSGAYSDYPKPVSLSWDALAGSGNYTLTIRNMTDATDKDVVIENISATSYDVYNLHTGTEYEWFVSRGSTTSDTFAFKTADTPRYIKAPNVRNIRDMGGWNGLHQGLAYRGGRLNVGGDALNTEGRRVLAVDLGMKSDIDFRTDSEIDGITSSPIGSGTTWFNYRVGSGNSLYSASYKEPFRLTFNVFAERKNYPVYFHCVGGADRTAVVAMILEALCGVSETDMAIDYELTSFSIWDYRHRYDDPASRFSTTYATTFKKFLTYEGASMPEKAENYLLSIGLTRSAISNIRSILSGNGVTFAYIGDAAYDVENYECELLDLGNHTVTDVTFNGASIPFAMNGDAVVMTLGKAGTGKITFEDGGSLSFDAAEAERFFTVSVPDGKSAGYITIKCDDEAAKDAVLAGLTLKKNGAAVTPTVCTAGNTVAIPVASLASNTAYMLIVNADGCAPYSVSFTTGTVTSTLFTLSPATASSNKADGVKLTLNVADPSVKYVCSLSDNVTSADTVFHSDGYLVVGKDETAKSITVTVSSVYEPDKKVSATVTVNDTVSTAAGTRANPIILANEADFLAFTNALLGGTNYSGKYVKLIADVNMVGVSVYNGMPSDKVFAGYFDGDGHTITVNISSDNDHCVFGNNTGTIVNTGFLGTIYSEGPWGAGGICRKNQGKIVNCYAKVNISGASPAALCRSCYGKMYNCYAYNAEAKFTYNPLLIQNDGEAWNVLYLSSADSFDAAATVPLTKASLDGTYAAMRLNDGIEEAAAKAGIPASALKKWYGEVAGGPVMVPPTAKVVSVAVSGVKQIVKGGSAPFTAAVTVIAGAPKTVTWTLTGATSAATRIGSDGTLTVGLLETASTLTVKATSTFDDTVFGTCTVTVTDIESSPKGSRYNPILIENEADFYNLSADIASGKQFADTYFRQTADLDMTSVSAYNGVPFNARFAGHYDGYGHTITVSITSAAQNNIFPYCTGTIMNLGTLGKVGSTPDSETDIYLSGLARSIQPEGNVINCYSLVSVNSRGNASGMSGSMYGSMTNCFFGGTLTASKSKNAFAMAKKDSTKFDHCFYLTSCGASCSYDGVLSTDQIMYPTSAISTMNAGRASAAKAAGVTEDEIAYWCEENGKIGQIMPGCSYKYDESKATVSVSAANLPAANGTAVIAAYNADGRLLAVKTVAFEELSGSVLACDAKPADVRVFFFDELNDLSPLAACVALLAID